MVFCGVNDFHPERVAGRAITGVVENYDVAETLALALRLHPGRSRVVAIGDRSGTGLAILNQVREGAATFGGRLAFDAWTQFSLEEIRARVRETPPATFYYFIPFYQSVGGRFASAQEVLGIVRAHTDAPMYSSWEFLLGHGIVGGKLISGRAHGKRAAEMALKLLSACPWPTAGDLRTPRRITASITTSSGARISRTGAARRQRDHQRAPGLLRAGQGGLLDPSWSASPCCSHLGAAGHEHHAPPRGRAHHARPALLPGNPHGNHPPAGVLEGPPAALPGRQPLLQRIFRHRRGPRGARAHRRGAAAPARVRGLGHRARPRRDPHRAAHAPARKQVHNARGEARVLEIRKVSPCATSAGPWSAPCPPPRT